VEMFSQMFDNRLPGGPDYRELMPDAEAATPPRQSAPMPRQVLQFWTPQLALRNFVHVLGELPRRPAPAIQPATISVPKADEPR
jgi:hypothetical protein